MRRNILIRVIVALIIYFGIKYLGGYWGNLLLYPIQQLVTFLHEFGHALGTILTGGEVEALQINEDGSGFTKSRGGNRAIILMGGYIGSAILGNLLFFISTKLPKFAPAVLYILAGLMVLSGLIWFNSLFTTSLLFIFSIGLFFVGFKSKHQKDVLMFLGLTTVLYIVEDFNVGPQSDLQQYAELFVFVPASAWMYIWLFIVLLICIVNIRFIFKEKIV